jgi:hypothetical protein
LSVPVSTVVSDRSEGGATRSPVNRLEEASKTSEAIGLFAHCGIAARWMAPETAWMVRLMTLWKSKPKNVVW